MLALQLWRIITPLFLRQEIHQAGDGGGEKYPRKLVPVKEGKAKHCGGRAGVDSGKKEPDGGKEKKPVPVDAPFSATGIGHGNDYRLETMKRRLIEHYEVIRK